MGIQQRAEQEATTPEELIATLKHFQEMQENILCKVKTRFNLHGKTIAECTQEWERRKEDEKREKIQDILLSQSGVCPGFYL